MDGTEETIGHTKMEIYIYIYIYIYDEKIFTRIYLCNILFAKAPNKAQHFLPNSLDPSMPGANECIA